MKKLYKLFSNFKKKQITLCILISIQMGLSAYIPFLIKNLINAITYDNNINTILHIVYEILFFTIINVFITNLQYYNWHKLRLESVNFLRFKMFESSLEKPKYFFDSKGIGKILALIMDDTSIIAQNGVIGIPMLFANLANFIIISLVLFNLNRKLTLLTLLIIPFYALFFNHFNKKIRKTSSSEREHFGLVMKDAEEKLQGIDTIKVFRINSIIIKNFKEKLDNHFKFLKKNLFYNSLGLSLNNLIIAILPVLILLYGSILINKKELSLGSLIAFFTYISNIYEPLSNLSDYNLGLQTSLSVSDRIINFLDLNKSKIQDKKIITSFESMEFINVYFAYKNEDFVLKNFNLKVNKGDHIGIVGKSGCGKSTLLKLLLGMYSPSSGKILINGINISEIDINSLYSIISIVEQTPFIFEETLKENLTLHTDISDSLINNISNLTHVAEIGDFSKKISINTLSVGQKQRICIARALLKNPQILILDEPTSALDHKLEKEIEKTIQTLTIDNTLIVITHRPGLLKYCNTILDLENINMKEKEIDLT